MHTVVLKTPLRDLVLACADIGNALVEAQGKSEVEQGKRRGWRVHGLVKDRHLDSIITNGRKRGLL